MKGYTFKREGGPNDIRVTQIIDQDTDQTVYDDADDSKPLLNPHGRRFVYFFDGVFINTSHHVTDPKLAVWAWQCCICSCR